MPWETPMHEPHFNGRTYQPQAPTNPLDIVLRSNDTRLGRLEASQEMAQWSDREQWGEIRDLSDRVSTLEAKASAAPASSPSRFTGITEFIRALGPLHQIVGALLLLLFSLGLINKDALPFPTVAVIEGQGR